MTDGNGFVSGGRVGADGRAEACPVDRTEACPVDRAEVCPEKAGRAGQADGACADGNGANAPRAVIIGASPTVRGAEMILPGDFVAVCDGGLEFALDRGIKFQLLVGDFDSYKGKIPEPGRGVDNDFELIRLPAEKDDTDIGFAAKTLLDRGFRDLLILGGTGGRLDHTLGNLCVAASVAALGGLCVLAGDLPGESLYVFRDRTVDFEPSGGAFLSIFPWGNEEAVVTAEGFKYPLLHGRIAASTTLGVSNEFAVSPGSRSPKAFVAAESGTVVVVVNREA
jgi:thiamine pyrophosphokinase